MVSTAAGLATGAGGVAVAGARGTMAAGAGAGSAACDERGEIRLAIFDLDGLRRIWPREDHGQRWRALRMVAGIVWTTATSASSTASMRHGRCRERGRQPAQVVLGHG